MPSRELTTATARRDARPVRHEFDAIGTAWSITTDEPLAQAATAAIAAQIEAFGATWSRFRSDSLVSRIRATPGRHRFPSEAAALFGLYGRLGRATGGRVNPLVGGRLESLGYGIGYTLRAAPDPVGVPRWSDAAHWDGAFLTTTEPVLVDVGAAGKGYLVDLVAAVLDDHGVEQYVVDAGGDLRHRGDRPTRVALEHPDDSTLAIGVVELSNQSLCASAPNRRSWGDVHHVLDGATGAPTRAIVATWALAPSALEADGLATSLFFEDAATLGRAGVGVEFEAIRITASKSVEATAGLEGALFR